MTALEKKQEEYRNSIEDPSQFVPEFVSFQKKYNNLNIELTPEETRFRVQSNTHASPVGGIKCWSSWDRPQLEKELKTKIPHGYLGWYSNWIIGFSNEEYNRFAKNGSFFDCSWGRVKSFVYLPWFHVMCSSGWPRPLKGKAETYMHYQTYWYLADFPKLESWHKRTITKEALKTGRAPLKYGELYSVFDNSEIEQRTQHIYT